METFDQTQHSQIDILLGELRAQGIRITSPRETIIQTILGIEKNFSPEELLGIVRKRNAQIGRATIFRTLDLLVKLGYVSRVTDGDRRWYTVCSPGHHYHLTCSGCGEVLHLDECPAVKIVSELEIKTGYQIEHHTLEFSGTCPSCQRRSG